MSNHGKIPKCDTFLVKISSYSGQALDYQAALLLPGAMCEIHSKHACTHHTFFLFLITKEVSPKTIPGSDSKGSFYSHELDSLQEMRRYPVDDSAKFQEFDFAFQTVCH